MRPNRHVIVENHSTSGKSVEIVTNDLGLRNPTIAPKSTEPGTRRILFLGDSITFEGYLNEKDTFVRQVEQLAAAKGKKWETINAGIDGVSFSNELTLLEEIYPVIQPDVVVFCFYLNDLKSSFGIQHYEVGGIFRYSRLAHYLVKAFWVQSIEWQKQDVLKHVLEETGSSRLMLNSWNSLAQETRAKFPPGPGDYRTKPSGFNRLILDSFIDWGNAWNDSLWLINKPLFEKLYYFRQIHKFDLRIIVFPIRQQVEANFVYDYPQQKLKSLGAEYNLDLLDLLPILREHLMHGGNHFYDHCHPTEATNRFIAQAIYDFL